MLAVMEFIDGSTTTKSGTRAQITTDCQLVIGNKDDSNDYTVDIAGKITDILFVDIGEEKKQKLIKTIKRMMGELAKHIAHSDHKNQTFLCGRMDALHTVLEMLEEPDRLDQMYYIYNIETEGT